MDPIRTFITRPIFTLMLVTTLFVFGVFAYPKIGVDQFPDVDFPVITVTTVLPGADPETIERNVSEPLEEALNTLSGIDTLRSINVENVSQVVVRFDLDKNVDVAAQDVRDRVQGTLSKLPREAEAPVVEKFDIGAAPIMTLAMSGSLPVQELSRLAEDVIKPALQQMGGVGAVDLIGSREREIAIVVDPTRLRGYGLAVTDVADALRAQHVDVPGGRTAEPGVERSVKLKAEAKKVDELRDLVVSSGGGSPVRLRDVADVVDGPAEARSAARLGRQSAIGLVVRKQSGANTVQVADAVAGGLGRLTKLMPAGGRLEVVIDNSAPIRASIGAVREDLVVGGVLAVFIVLVFLRNWRSTLVAAVALPASVVGTFAVMQALGFTFNIVTMLALTLSIGLLIDDAIVVIENVVRHLEHGESPAEAAHQGTREIAVAVLAVTGAIVAVFVPVAFMEGMIGRFFYQFGITVATAVLISYFVSMTLTPTLSARVLKEGGAPGRLSRAVERVLVATESGYRRALTWMLGHRALTLVGAVAVLLLTLGLARGLKFTFIPEQDQSIVKVTAELPVGSRLEETERQVDELARQIDAVPGVLVTFVTAGGGAQEEVHRGEVTVKLAAIERRGYRQGEFKQHLRQALRPHVGTKVSVQDYSPIAGGGNRSQPVQLNLRGNDWNEVLASVEKVRAAMLKNPGFADVDTTYRAGKPQLQVDLDRDRAAALGLPAATVGQTLRAYLGRDKIADYREGGETYDVRLRLPDAALADPEALGALQVRAPGGRMIELRNVAEIKSGEGPSQIEHQAQLRQVTLLAELRGYSLSEAMAFLEDVAKRELPPTVQYDFEGQSRELGKTGVAFLTALVLGLVLVYIILAAQFESLTHPFTIMMALPFAVIGAIGALLITGQYMSMFAMIGMIMLMGLVTKNGILLVEFTNQLREQGRGVREALLEAGPIRLRPILMTTIAMIAGMVPPAIATGPGAETRAPMAVTIIGGLVTSTVLTLGVVPVVYSLVEGLRRRVLGRRVEAAAGSLGPEPRAAELRGRGPAGAVGRRAARAQAGLARAPPAWNKPRPRTPMAHPTLSAALGDLVELPGLPAGPDPDLEDPLPSLEPPEGRPLVRVRQAAEAAAAGADPLRHLVGVVGAAPALVAAELRAATGRLVVCVVDGLERANRLAADLNFLAGDRREGGEGGALGRVLVLPPYETSPYADVNSDRRAAMARLAVLHHVASGGGADFLIVTAASLARKFVAPGVVRRHALRVEAEQELDRDAFIAGLARAGYLRVPVVEDPGSFAVRGGLIDLWPASLAEPVRVELYGDLVLSLKQFEPESQRTLREVPAVALPPAREAVLTDEAVGRAREALRALCDATDWPSTKARQLSDDVTAGRGFFGADGFLPAFGELAPLFDYLPEGAAFVLEDPPALTRALRDELGRAMADENEKLAGPHFPRHAFYATEPDVADELAARPFLALHRGAVEGGASAEDFERFEAAPPGAPTLDARDHDDLDRAVKRARQARGKAGTLEPLVRRVHAWHEAGLRVVLAARAETQAERLVALLRHAGVEARLRAGGYAPEMLADPAGRGVALVVHGPLARGAVLPGEALALVTEEEIFGARAHRRPARERAQRASAAKPFLEDLRELAVGDFVVHSEHGVGRYLGLLHKAVGEHTVDLLAVEYAGGDKLYLPVYRLNQIQKFRGAEGAPKLDRLGGVTFGKTKQRVEKQVRQMADELLRLYAERQAVVGEALAPPDDEYRTFEATFPFDETPDQGRAIGEVLRDLEAPRPMDRLVCGDVGFGKTEVAIRAAFRVAMEGKQVAVLCPTTVLAQQHFLNFEARFRDYPLRVAVLSRFQTKAELDRAVRDVKEGKVDVVVGTHRLLSKDIHFKRLGLLVVDEEQRFGVTHKERIKQLRRNVDVLTLSATPIPRTLQMAVSGLRDMSLITTPPVDRRAIRTLVTRYDDTVLREAVRRELGRGGQAFYVYNRVEGLYERAAKLQSLVPEARVAVAHGQMGEGALERAMIDFVEGRFDVLCATAIIESGLDIARANTIIIDRADMFGLAQLYQLRGRVGRSKERAYCYLVVPPANSLTDEARARIEALERHTELGSGFQIASLDLELRGAGDLLGAEQSGAVASVGFDLFCTMLEGAVRELRGETVVHEVEPDLNVDVEALLPEAYVDEVGVRLSLYKRLASAADEAEIAELAAEMEDRFGAPPPEAKNLVELMRIKTELRRLRALGLEASARSVTLHLREDTPLEPAKVMGLVQKKGSPYKLTPDMRLTRRFAEAQPPPSPLANAEALLADLAACLKA